MKNVVNKYLRITFVTCMIIAGVTIIGCGDKHKGHNHNDMDKQETKVDSTIIRSGEIDLQSLDLNNDGMLYQDPMDWNVIADEPGKCPLCKMELKEVSTGEAKNNLIENGFKVKE